MRCTGERSSLRSNEERSASYIDNRNEISLSNTELIEIIKGVLEKGASFRFSASGYSMQPFIKNGDILTLTPITNRISVGDVIVFVHPRSGRLTIHRIVRKNNGIYDVKGDNMQIIDGRISRDNIIGKVSKVERMKRSVHAGLGQEKFFIAMGSRINLLCRVNRFKQQIYAIAGKVIHVA